jgi:aminoglycoside phosphotransferase family enzyme
LEITLNRRLSRGIYLDVARIGQKNGEVTLDGSGRTIEYAVKMKQISETLLMDRLLERGLVTTDMVEQVAVVLAGFYKAAETNERIRSFARPERIKQDTDENFDQTEKYIGTSITKDQFSEIQRATNIFFQDKRALFVDRMRGDWIRDCHGDLRLEHILVDEGVSILDCIEFCERLRYTDVAADIGFLAMDFDYRNHRDLGEHLVRSYVDRSGDREVYRVLDFYKCYRAYVRGKVESFRLDDPNIRNDEKERARVRAVRYFDLSQEYAGRLS